ncbi:MAG: protein translocase subunit SecD [Candidatus Zixiibacteriota bacterium]
MNRTQMWRVVITALLLFTAVYYSWPTVRYWTTPETEKQQLKETDPSKLLKMKQEAIRLGLDLQGGIHMVLRVQLEKLSDVARKEAVDRAIAIIRNRVDGLGVAEPVIQKSGNDRIIVDLPGFTDPERARKMIGDMARLEFKLLESAENAQLLLSKIDKALSEMEESPEESSSDQTEPAPETAEKKPDSDTTEVDVMADLMGEQPGDSIDDFEALTEEELDMPFSIYLEAAPQALGPEWFVEEEIVATMKSKLDKPAVKQLIPSDVQFAWGTKSEIVGGRRVLRLYLLNSRVQMSGEYLTDANPSYDQYGKPRVEFRLTREGGRRFSRVTGPNVGKPLAIVLDDKVESAPRINDRIRDQGTITMGTGSTYQEAHDMAIVLKAGALPTDVEIIESSIVGPSLGEDSIRRGIRSVIIALCLVLLFVAVYYRLSGLIADMALIANLFFLLAAIAGLSATLTMPGIAGIILTIGISVDANVLIFERIREELRTGKTVRAAIDAGYDRAVITIIDSHVTTLAAAGILFMFGSGSIKGFAVSLFLGVLISLYTALVITRSIFVSRKKYKTLSI